MASSREQPLPLLAQTISLEESIFAPLQLRLEDIPVVEYEFEGGEDTYKLMMKKRKVRQRDIASLLLGQYRIPVAPFPNPRKKYEISHHIIRMTSSTHARYAVDILVRDTDLYFAAFRRRLDNVWGTWFHYDDQTLPCFITGTKVGFESEHKGSKRTTLGGMQVIEQTFLTLAKYEERLAQLNNNQSQKKKQDVGPQSSTLREKLEKAMLVIIVMFSEANRFRCIYEEIVRRIESGEDGSELDATMWSLINDWGTWSSFLLALWAKNPIIPMQDDLPQFKVEANQPPESDSKRRKMDLLVRDSKTNEMTKLKKVRDMAGPNGQLMLIKYEQQWMMDPSILKKRMDKIREEDVMDPMFVKNDECYFCKESGHWQRNCVKYLEQAKKNKAAKEVDQS